jgi:hypothetical protein
MARGRSPKRQCTNQIISQPPATWPPGSLPRLSLLTSLSLWAPRDSTWYSQISRNRWQEDCHNQYGGPLWSAPLLTKSEQLTSQCVTASVSDFERMTADILRSKHRYHLTPDTYFASSTYPYCVYCRRFRASISKQCQNPFKLPDLPWKKDGVGWMIHSLVFSAFLLRSVVWKNW